MLMIVHRSNLVFEIDFRPVKVQYMLYLVQISNCVRHFHLMLFEISCRILPALLTRYFNDSLLVLSCLLYFELVYLVFKLFKL
jgi:hypothetical protein